MQVVFLFDADRRSEVDNIVNQEPIVRQSIISRSADTLDMEKEGMVIFIEGTEEACKEAEEKLKDIVTQITGDEAQKIISKIKEAEEKSMEGFGNIF